MRRRGWRGLFVRPRRPERAREGRLPRRPRRGEVAPGAPRNEQRRTARSRRDRAQLARSGRRRGSARAALHRGRPVAERQAQAHLRAPYGHRGLRGRGQRRAGRAHRPQGGAEDLLPPQRAPAR